MWFHHFHWNEQFSVCLEFFFLKNLSCLPEQWLHVLFLLLISFSFYFSLFYICRFRFFLYLYFRYVPPPPSRPRYNDNNDIATNNIPIDNKELIKRTKYDKGFFVDVPPKFYKTASPAKQQFYQQQYLNDVFSKNYYNKANKYSIIAFKDKYRGLPYYVVSTTSNYR